MGEKEYNRASIDMFSCGLWLEKLNITIEEPKSKKIGLTGDEILTKKRKMTTEIMH